MLWEATQSVGNLLAVPKQVVSAGILLVADAAGASACPAPHRPLHTQSPALPAPPEISPALSCPQNKPNPSFLVNHSKVQGKQQLSRSALSTKGSSMVTAGLVYLPVISPLLRPMLLANSQLLNNDTPKVAEIGLLVTQPSLSQICRACSSPPPGPRCLPCCFSAGLRAAWLPLCPSCKTRVLSSCPLAHRAVASRSV